MTARLPRSLRCLLLPALPLLLAGCGFGMAKPDHVQTDRMLEASGFRALFADTPERRRQLDDMPPWQIWQVHHRDQTFYLHADPVYCKCIYVGDAAALAQYRQHHAAAVAANPHLHLDQPSPQAARLEACAFNFDWDLWPHPFRP